MAGLDEESGLLKPTVQKTRGLTALVVAAAALSFFAGAAAATHATTTTELWPKIPKAPMGCTMMFCDTPQEPKCLEYKKD